MADAAKTPADEADKGDGADTTRSAARPDRVLGGPHDDFWSYCARNELWMQRCETCGQFSWPPVAERCEHCEGPKLQWQRLSGRGRVVSWCTFERAYYDNVPVPWDTIVVALDEGPWFISNPHGFTNHEITSGMGVQVAFVVCHDGAGEFLLPVFERVDAR